MNKKVEVKADIEEFQINALYPNLYHESVSRAWKWPSIEIASYLHGAHIFCGHEIAEEINFLKSINYLKEGE